jgi:hypothetical protein
VLRSAVKKIEVKPAKVKKTEAPAEAVETEAAAE